MKTKKQDIINFLKRYKRMSTTKIAAMICLSTTNARKYLEQLVEEKKIIKEEETIATYWRLKE